MNKAEKVYKAKQADALLQRIVDRLELGEIVEVEDVAALEGLLWEYKEFEAQDTTCLGLRNRVPNKFRDLDATSGLGERMQIAVHYMRKGIAIPTEIAAEFIKRACAYLDKKVPVAKLFGERDRRPREGYTWQAEATMGEIAEKVFERVRCVDGEPLDISFPDKGSDDDQTLSDNLYRFLADLSIQALDSDLIRDYRLDNTDSTKRALVGLKALIFGESDAFEDDYIPLKLLTTPSLWYAAHLEYASAKNRSR